MKSFRPTQEEMQRGQAESESTMKAINDCVAFAELTAEGKFMNINENFLNIMGYRKEDLVGEHHRIFVPKGEKMDESYKELWRSIGNGQVRQGDFTRITKSGESRTLFESYAPVFKKDGSIGKVLLFVNDLTTFISENRRSQKRPWKILRQLRSS